MPTKVENYDSHTIRSISNFLEILTFLELLMIILRSKISLVQKY